MILIGSRAAEFHGLPLNRRSKDIDVIATPDEAHSFVRGRATVVHPIERGKKLHAIIYGRHWEIELAWTGSTAHELLDLYKDAAAYEILIGETRYPMQVADLDLLLTLKLSHRYLKDSPHFRKTMADIALLRDYSMGVPERLRAWFKRREKETYWYKHPNLQVQKGDFFKGDGINYVFDHDSIHEAVKHGDVPAYTLFKKDGAEVAVDVQKWADLPLRVKLHSVVEEAYVLALERSQIPYRGKGPGPSPTITPYRSFEIALMKVCTSITSGWWREWAWEHYDEALVLYDDTYVDRFWRAERDGIVKPYTAPMGAP